eukprot:TRINITY_DN9192_c0_g1_i3.p1 TRINITY_DN9192_c0_g1~~TRINITY_DN9192_c0_g1_i3.p1  ORF type:complete len:605 (-),score=140.88 TRINITY_DN9192_c0_g1_i3:722-2536(-)
METKKRALLRRRVLQQKEGQGHDDRVSSGRELLKESDVVVLSRDSVIQTTNVLSPFLMSDWSYDSVDSWMRSKLRTLEDTDATLNHYLSTNRRFCERLVEENGQAKAKHQLTEAISMIQRLDDQIVALEGAAGRRHSVVSDSEEDATDMEEMDHLEGREKVLDDLKAVSLRLKTLQLQGSPTEWMPLRERRLQAREKLALAAEMRRAAPSFSLGAKLWLKFKLCVAGAEIKPDGATVEPEIEDKGDPKEDGLVANLLSPALSTIDMKLGPNVTHLFVSYRWLLASNCAMFLMWSLVVILPFLINPPESFSWDAIEGPGFLGGSDKGIEHSFFYYGAYPATIQLGGWTYQMDIAYVSVLVLMFMVQMISMLMVVWREAGKEEATDDAPEFMQRVLVTYYFNIRDTKIVRAHHRAVTRALRNQIQLMGECVDDTPLLFELRQETERASSVDCCSLTMLGRVTGIFLYLALFPASYLCIYYLYDNSEAITDIISFGVPLLVASVRILFPLYLVPLFMRVERRPDQERFWHSIIREFVLKLFTVNSLLFVYLQTSAKPDDMCRQIYIGKTFWRQEIMDIVFHVVLDAIFCHQRWKLAVRPQFDRVVVA